MTSARSFLLIVSGDQMLGVILIFFGSVFTFVGLLSDDETQIWLGNFIHSLTRSFAHSFTPSLRHHSLPHSLIHSLSSSLSYSLTLSLSLLSPSLSLFHSLIRLSLTYHFLIQALSGDPMKRRPNGSVGKALVLPALTDCRWWFESLPVQSGVSSATPPKGNGRRQKKNPRSWMYALASLGLCVFRVASVGQCAL